MDNKLPLATTMVAQGLMRHGLGYDDIAVRMGIDAKYIRAEAARLRGVGMLDVLYRVWRE